MTRRGYRRSVFAGGPTITTHLRHGCKVAVDERPSLNASHARGERLSDFPASASRLSEGFCPLCRFPLKVTSANGEYSGTCTRCDDISWRLTTIDGRPTITTSRRLRPDEVTFLYNQS